MADSKSPHIEPQKTAPKNIHDSSTHKMKGARIVLAEDNPDMREYIRRLLSPSHEVIALSNGEEALKAIREQLPDLIISDMIMPKMDGLALLQAVRADPDLASVPILMLSALSGEARMEGLQAGADGYIIKPFSARELLARVEGMLNLNRVRQDAALELRKSEEWLRFATQTGKVGVWDWDIRTNRVSWSDSLYIIHGISKQEFNPTVEGFGALLHPEDREEVSRSMEQALKVNAPYEFEFRAIKPDGDIIWLFTNAIVLRDENGNPARLLGSTVDITYRKKTEIALRESEQRYRQLVHSLPAAVYTCDNQGRVLLYNEAAVDLWGRKPDLEKDIWGGSYRLYELDGKEIPPDSCPMAIAVKQAKALHMETIVERPDGTRRHVLTNPQPIHNSQGEITGAINIMLDITERKRSEVELAATKDDLALQVKALTRLHELSIHLSNPLELESSLQGILDTIVELHEAHYGLMTLFNEETKSFQKGASVGISDEVFKAHISDPYISNSTKGVSSSVFIGKKRIIVEDIETEPLFEEFRKVAELVGFRSVHSTPIMTRSGEILGVLTVYFKNPRRPSQREMQLADMCARHAADIIATIQAQQDLRESEQRLRRINNELEERVRERTLQLEKQSNRLRVLADQVAATEQQERKRIAAILHDHLQQILVAGTFQLAEAFRRVKEGQFEGVTEYLNRGKDLLNEAIRSARSLTAELRPPVLYEDGLIAAFKWLARKFEMDHDLKVKLKMEEAPFSLSDGLKIMIFESVKELLFNVIKHSKVKEATLVFKPLDDNSLYVCISDEGVGFDLPRQERLFAGHERGLGLFSIRERLKLLDAAFEIISTPGLGTKIEIIIPPNQFSLKEEKKNEKKIIYSPEKLDEKKGKKKIKILLVDDHRLVREGVANILKKKAFFQIVAQAENGIEAHEKTASYKPDVIIMDVNMPHLNGIEATRLIKRDFPQVHVIGLSVQDENDVADSMKKAGAFALLNKAGDPKDLINAILSSMQRR